MALIVPLQSGVQAGEPAEELYGMVVFLKGSEFFNWCYAGFKDAAATVGSHVKTEYLGPADWDASGEAKAVEQLIAMRARGIAVTAGDADTLVGAINRSIDSKIPCLTFDSDSPKSRRLLFVGTDSYQSGYEAGLIIAQLLGDKAKVGISLIPGLDSITHRVAGFEAALKEKAPGAKVIAKVNDEGDINKAEQVLTAMLQANPEINAIFCGHGNPATGAMKAVINVGRDSGDSKVHVMAYSIDVPILEAVDNDELVGTVAQYPYLMGVMSFLNLYSAAHPTQFDNPKYPGFGMVPTANIDTGVRVLMKGDPLLDYLKNPPKM
jgi:ribose transport system substrate-binding protein